MLDEHETSTRDDTYFFDVGFAVRCFAMCWGHFTISQGLVYNIDARDVGNISRFINHSCAANLWPVTVLRSGQAMVKKHKIVIRTNLFALLDRCTVVGALRAQVYCSW